MKTKLEVKREIIDSKVAEWFLSDLQANPPGLYKTYIEAGHEIARMGHVERLAKDHYTLRLKSGEKLVMNGDGTCKCADSTIAPHGWCAHRIAQRLEFEALSALEARKTDAHGHGYICKHLPDAQCWDSKCAMPRHLVCPDCENAGDGQEDVSDYVVVSEESMYEPNPQETATPALELAPVVVPDEWITPFLPEAAVSLCLKMRLPGNHEMSYTMRGHQDYEVLARLPLVLAGLQRAIDPGSEDSGWLHRIYQAFLPARMRKQEDKA